MPSRPTQAPAPIRKHGRPRGQVTQRDTPRAPWSQPFRSLHSTKGVDIGNYRSQALMINLPMEFTSKSLERRLRQVEGNTVTDFSPK
ncbi:hypothetical protein JTE90_008325 [Oedothorax gibbosus]|uniref:Uncharacterized protein n=1 Tax=Oedothorax gibbosus TaxID=931172 RepID=A0AAV6U025_9ARAC|nr:hypothetical protein JTE90_008325 [Oedothorax gibbosus]